MVLLKKSIESKHLGITLISVSRDSGGFTWSFDVPLFVKFGIFLKLSSRRTDDLHSKFYMKQLSPVSVVRSVFSLTDTELVISKGPNRSPIVFVNNLPTSNRQS